MNDAIDELSRRLAQDLEDAIAYAFMGDIPKPPQRAIRLRYGRIETVG